MNKTLSVAVLALLGLTNGIQLIKHHAAKAHSGVTADDFASFDEGFDSKNDVSVNSGKNKEYNKLD